MFMIYANGKLIYQPGGSEKLQLVSPKLTVEIGKAGSLDFSVPPTHLYYQDFQQLRSVLTVKMDSEEIFRGRVLSNKRTFTNMREIYGEGNLAYLVDSVQKATKYSGTTGALFRQIIAAHNTMIKDPEKQFTVGTISPEFENVSIVLIGKSKDSSSSDQMEELETSSFNYKQIALDSIADEWQTTFDYIETCLIDYVGGYLRTRRDEATGINYIDWLKDYFSTSSQRIEFGKNILDLTEEVNAEEVFSVLIPLGDENLTIADVNGGSIELVNQDALERYGRIVKTNVFDSVTDAHTLLENGRRYLEANAKIHTTITVTAVDLHLLNPNIQSISLGDRVYILSPAHNIDNRELTCTKIEYDLANPANNVYTFGDEQQTLTERYRKDKQKRSSGGSSAAAATAEQVDENQTDFYKAWVEVQDDKGHIDLGTLFKRVHGGNTELAGGTLITLDSNPEHSAIDIWADHSQWEQDREKLKYMAGINLDTTDTSASVNIYAMDKITQKTARFLQSVRYNETTGKAEAITQLQSDVFNIDSKVTNINGILNAITINTQTMFVKRNVVANSITGTYITGATLWMSFDDAGMGKVNTHKHQVIIDGKSYMTSVPIKS